ncbi:MAG: hypothetical protein EBZ48_12265 [Proteobacteria bacterium]|nr:hypothetical protein [Pseudomonadota bacterium]
MLNAGFAIDTAIAVHRGRIHVDCKPLRLTRSRGVNVQRIIHRHGCHRVAVTLAERDSRI